AEDGIRDFHVTGVQTCALPILAGVKKAAISVRLFCVLNQQLNQRNCCRICCQGTNFRFWPCSGIRLRPSCTIKAPCSNPVPSERSEERRVGKTFRSYSSA